MKKNLSFKALRRVFAVCGLLIIFSFLGFLVYLYFAFNGLLTGDVKVELSPDLLANLQTQRFETAVDRMERRRSIPDITADMPDPFDAPK